MSRPPKLLTYPFLALNAAVLFGFCNIAVFYSFDAYLSTLGIPPQWRGLLLALEPLAALVLRPIISPLLNLRNGARVMLGSLFLIAVALVSYPVATSIPALAALRLFHGAAFVALVSAATALLVHFIPKEKSARGFGVFTIMTLAPFALMPPLVESALPVLGSAARVYAVVAVLMVPAVACLLPLLPRTRAMAAALPPADLARPTLAEIAADLRTPGVARFLAANLFLFCGTTTVFFYMKDHALHLGLPRVDLFFTISTGATIAVRAAGAAVFDKLNKRLTMIVFFLLLAACFALFARTRDPAAFLALAGVYGLALGVALPILSASLFLASPVRFRGLNTNLFLVMMDAGYVLGPLLGGWLLALGLPFAALFRTAAAFALLACLAAGSARGIATPTEEKP